MKPRNDYAKKVYRQVIGLSLLVHFSYVVIFFALHLPGLAVYNVCSILFYLAMWASVTRGYFRLAVSCIHVEVCMFVTVSTLAVGWETGIALFLIAMTSLTYFCPYQHDYVPYLFAILEAGTFLALKIYTIVLPPPGQVLSDTVTMALFLYSACACFIFIVFAAFSSKVSASVSRRELQRVNRSLSVLANYDQLTGLLSRHAFLAKMRQVRSEDVVLSLGDIDDFKVVNDTWGHACGDMVLNEVAELIRHELGGVADACRWGGEEFVFLFRKMPLSEVTAEMQRVCDRVAAHTFCWDEVRFHITMTFGVSADAAGLSEEEVVALADKGMYEGKSRGKNQVVCVPYGVHLT